MSSSQRNRRIEELFAEALSLAPGQRRPFLERACGDDRELCDHVAQLLDADKQAGTLSPFAPWQSSELDDRDELDELDEDSLRPGDTVGKYRVVAKLGQGGMGQVYVAHHPELDRQAAIKVLRPGLSDNKSTARRFIREARSAAGIRHPGIVDIFDIDRLENGNLYILMEFLDGESLATRLDQVGAFAEDVAVSLIRQAADALAPVHAKGIVHRDLKPDNLFLIPDSLGPGGERLKLLDFGIAKLRRSDGDSSDASHLGTITQSGVIMGTPPYMSPEQCRSADTADPRSDLYSLGVIFFEMLCGTRPFVCRSTFEYIVAHIEQPPPSVARLRPEVSEGVIRVVQRLLAKNPEERYPSSSALVIALDEVATGGAALRREIGPTRPRRARSGGRHSSTLPLGFRQKDAPDMDSMPTAPATRPEPGRPHSGGSDAGRSLTAGGDPGAPETWIETAEESAPALAAPEAVRAPFWNVPDLPPHYLPRDELSALCRILLRDPGPGDDEPTRTDFGPVATRQMSKLGLHGMGGIGKSVLAAALAQHDEVRAHFRDGIYWLAVGQKPQLVPLLTSLARALGEPGEAIQPIQPFQDIREGKQVLRRALHDRRVLLVLDDIWDIDHLSALAVIGAEGRLLVTTRDREILVHSGATEYNVDVLPDERALELLSEWTEVPMHALPDEAAEVARACGHLPLALAMVGALVRLRTATWTRVLTWLGQARLAKVKGRMHAYPYRTVLSAIEVGVNALAEAEDDTVPEARQCYIDLAVFPEDTAIPRAALRVLWATRGLDQEDADDLMGILANRALATVDDSRALRLHDLQRAYVIGEAENMADLHGRLVDAYAARCRDGLWSGLDDGYFFQRLPYHLARAGRHDESCGLLLDYRWIDAKLRATSSNELLADYDLVEVGRRPGRAESGQSLAVGLVHDGLRLSSHILALDPRHLPGQLLGRLGHFAEPGRVPRAPGAVLALLEASGAESRYSWLRPVHAALIPPGGALRRTLSGHDEEVVAVAMTPDGKQVVSGSEDHSIRVWDLESGQQVHCMTGHRRRVRAVAITPDGKRVLSGSDDGTIRVWDLEHGEALQVLSRHNRKVRALAISPDGSHVISGSHDQLVKVWHLASGREVTEMAGHEGGVLSVALSPDGQHIVSGSSDGTVRVWDFATGRAVHTFTGHQGHVHAVAVSPDGATIVSGSSDSTLRVWDLASGQVVRSFVGGKRQIFSVVITPDGNHAISGSWDRALRVWDLASGQARRTLMGHSLSILSLVLAPDGERVISASADKTLKVWDLTSAVDGASGHRGTGQILTQAGRVNAVALTPDGQRAVVGSSDYTVQVWNLATLDEPRLFRGHDNWVGGVAVTPDGQRVVSASYDRHLKIWELASGRELATLSGHSDWVKWVTVTPDGTHAVSASSDKTVKIWHLGRAEALRTLEGHDGVVRRVALSRDGARIFSASFDRTVRRWDFASGEPIGQPLVHPNRVFTVDATPDGRHVISGCEDGAIRVWHLPSGRVVRVLSGHKDQILALRVNQAGTRLISGSMDQTLRVWDLGSGRQLEVFHSDFATACCVTDRNDEIIVAGGGVERLHVLRPAPLASRES